MKHKDDLAIEKILDCARQEFLEKGFADASMRAIAEKAGYTTGMLYGRFADKSRIFREIVAEGADELLDWFSGLQDEFAQLPPERQRDEMLEYVDGKLGRFVDIVYDHFDAFKLIVTKSAGSGYEYYIDKMIDIETANTERFIRALNASGTATNEVRADLSHMLSSALFNGMFEVVALDFPKEDALTYVRQLERFFHAGWYKLLGLQ